MDLDENEYAFVKKFVHKGRIEGAGKYLREEQESYFGRPLLKSLIPPSKFSTLNKDLLPINVKHLESKNKEKQWQLVKPK